MFFVDEGGFLPDNFEKHCIILFPQLHGFGLAYPMAMARDFPVGEDISRTLLAPWGQIGHPLNQNVSMAAKGSDWVLTVQFPTPNNQYLYTMI